MAKKKVKSKAKQAPKPSIPDSISSEVIAAAYSSVPVLMKVCRLCETKDGPFLNIFDADKVTAKKIDELMPFGVAENDDLPHKICFRCSAKLEELHEFIQKCIKTQENLRTALGKTGPLIMKTKTRTVWEEKLNKTNMSNDDICDALIKKAMEGIKDIPIKSLPIEEEVPAPTKRVTRRTEQTAPKKESTLDENEDSEGNLKQPKITPEKCNVKVPPFKPTRSKNFEATESSSNKIPQNEKKPSESKSKTTIHTLNSLSFDYEEEKKSSDNDEANSEKPEKPFNIMDYISMIKVNGVGVLFQCKLCNRNFLKKEVVESHNCAKNGIPKVETPKTVHAPEPPKVSTVKYIKIDNDMQKSLSLKSKLENDKVPTTNHKSKIDIPHSDKNIINDDDPNLHKNSKQEDTSQSAPKLKPKPRAGPASKTRRIENDSNSGPSQKDSDSQELNSSNTQSPSVHIPSVPNLNGRYKLVPGPNNIFTLVEDSIPLNNQVPVKDDHKSSKKRKSDHEFDNTVEPKSKDRKRDSREKSSLEVIDVEDQPKPYPVGLFQTVGHSSRHYDGPVAAAPPTPFATPTIKKQSYTIVQTGNPSKLLISTKAQAPPAEVPKKRQRKTLDVQKEDSEPKEPFTVTLEDVAHPKDAGFFTFINVDPLLQPSYVLPTDNIIQESQISTSTSAVRNAIESIKETKDKDKYSCNMCGEAFSREKKLLSHIQSHYSKMDEEDQLRAEKGSKKKGRK